MFVKRTDGLPPDSGPSTFSEELLDSITGRSYRPIELHFEVNPLEPTLV
jgi:hypothetical protein